MNKTFEEEINQQIADGYIAEDLRPLKCFHCESSNFKETTWYEDNNILIEINVTCADCGEKVGDWSYGSWMI